MKRWGLVLSCVVVGGAVLVALPRASTATNSVQCMHASDCAGSMGCSFGTCVEQCLADRDCGPGNRCVRSSNPQLTRCELLPAPPPPSTGTVFGYVADANGTPVTCSVHLLTGTVTAACNDAGYFVLSGVPASAGHRLELSGAGKIAQTITVPVVGGAVSGVGTIVLKPAVAMPSMPKPGVVK